MWHAVEWLLRAARSQPTIAAPINYTHAHTHSHARTHTHTLSLFFFFFFFFSLCFFQVVANDSNVINVALAADCIGAIASGLRDRFSSYAPLVLDTLLDKFKEKKLNVVTALQKAVPAVLAPMAADKAIDSLVLALKQKNPLQVQHAANTVATSIAVVSKSPLPKPQLAPLCKVLASLLTAREADVRTAATAALASLVSHSGEKAVRPYLADVDKKKADKIVAGAAAAKDTGAAKAPAKAKAKARPGASGARKSTTAGPSSSSSSSSSGAARPRTSKASTARTSRARKSSAVVRPAAFLCVCVCVCVCVWRCVCVEVWR